MTVFKRRSRMVSFRVSEEEYHQLREVSQAQGARSISDFARSATRYWSNASGTRFPEEVLDLHGKIHQLNTEIERIRRLLEL